jgi:hypothetical protein
MKRQQFTASLSRGDELIAKAIAFAHNSGVRQSEALARAYARERGVMLHGDTPARDESGYVRVWRTADQSVALIARVVPA